MDSTVTLPNHTTIFVSGISDIMLSSDLTLRNVLFVPQFKFNLLFVGALTSNADDDGLLVSFLRDSLCIQEMHIKNMICKSEKYDGLYVLDFASLTASSTTFVNVVSVHTWHARLGHLSLKRLVVL